jgi:drug/metabolite transporter (DMT)-like permease
MSTDRLSGRELWGLVLLTILWGLNWPVMKTGVSAIAPMTFRSLSMILALPMLWWMIRAAGESIAIPRAHWREMGLIALFNMVIWYVCVMYGVSLLSSGRAAILGYTMPIWAAVLGMFLYRERPGVRLAAGVTAAAGGVALLMASELSTISGSPAGTALMLCAAIAWAYGTHLTRKRTLPGSIKLITFWSVLLSLVVCGALAIATEIPRWAPEAIGWPAIFAVLYNGFVMFGVAQLLWFRLASTLSPVASGLSVLMIPVIGLFSGSIALGESLHWQDGAALACVVFAIAMVLLPARRRAGG